MFDYLVIGKGMIGTSALRFLSQINEKTAIIGPSEPKDWQKHSGLFASHYDEGRITRILDEDETWALLAKRSIEHYALIEKGSGVSFYSPVGGLQVAPPSKNPSDYATKLQLVNQQLSVGIQEMSNAQMRKQFPYFDFPLDFMGFYENPIAGYLNPRRLIEAQLILAQKNHAHIIDQTVASVHNQGNFVEVQTQAGEYYRAKRVLLATGAYSNLLWPQPLDLLLKALTILFARIPQNELEHFTKMPTLIYEGIQHPNIPDIYLLPPVLYPDGNYYIKIGSSNYSAPLHSHTDFLHWFHSNGSISEAEALKDVLCKIMPSLENAPMHSKPCVTTHTDHGAPYIDMLEDQRIFIAIGGCGAAAKSSVEIGKMAALLTQHGQWHYDLPQTLFRAVFAD